MSFPTIRQTLAHAADNFGCQVFETKGFVDRVHAALDKSQKWHQRECAMKAPLVMSFVFLMILYRSKSVAKIVMMLLMQYRHGLPDVSLDDLTPEAAIHARARLGKEPFRYFFESQAAEIRPKPAMSGLRFWSADGLAFNVPDTKANEKYFGRQKASRGTTAFPQFKVVPLVDTTTRQVRAIAILPKGGNERDGVVEILGNVPKGDVLTMDRGISASWLFALILKQRKHFLARISSSWKPTIIKKLGEGDYLVEIHGEVPAEHRSALDGKASVTLKVRMLEYQVAGGERVRLLTSLKDPKAYPALELAKSYHLRWESELANDELKNHLATVSTGALDLLFRSKNPDGVLQETYALFALYNIIRGTMVHAAALCQVEPLDISFSDTVHVIQETTARYQAASTDEARVQVYRQLFVDIGKCRNKRPRRPRQYPRVVKTKMSKFKCKRKRHKEKPLNIDRDLKMVG